MSIITRLPVTASSTLSTIPQEDIESFVSWEIDAYDHWIFDTGNSAGLTGLAQSKILTLQGSAPTYSSTHISLPGTSGNALLTDLTETASQADTIFMVLRLPATFSGLHFPFGTLNTTAPLLGGSPFFNNTANTYPRSSFLTYRGTSLNSTSAPSVPTANQWYFLCVSRDFASVTKTCHTLLGGTSIQTVTVTGTYTPAAGRFIALGNGYYATGTATASFDVAEFGIINRALSTTEVNNLYSRRKTIAAARGITVV